MTFKSISIPWFRIVSSFMCKNNSIYEALKGCFFFFFCSIFGGILKLSKIFSFMKFTQNFNFFYILTLEEVSHRNMPFLFLSVSNPWENIWIFDRGDKVARNFELLTVHLSLKMNTTIFSLHGPIYEYVTQIDKTLHQKIPIKKLWFFWVFEILTRDEVSERKNAGNLFVHVGPKSWGND